MATDVLQQSRLERLSADDFETASIRSAAPSYVSEAPSYHSTMPTSESLPAYSQPRNNTQTSNAEPSPNSSSMIPQESSSSMLRGPGLPPIPDNYQRPPMPQLNQFRIPSWSTLHSNPTARHYQAVANRRVSASHNTNNDPMPMALRNVLSRVTEEEEREKERDRLRPLEDPYLVGEEAAAKARRERLARENGDDILIRENYRWDFLLAQMGDWEQRSQSWKEFTRRRQHRRW